MRLNGTGSFLGNQKYVGKEKTYYSADFIDVDGSQINVSVDAPLQIEQFSRVNITVDVLQGKYPRYNLVSVSPVK